MKNESLNEKCLAAAEYDFPARSGLFQKHAEEVLRASGIAGIWCDAGCRVNIVGSMAMGLMATHRDIDLHVYSPEITERSSFAIASRMAADPRIKEIKCVNGLHTDERCVAWHVMFEHSPGETWQFDIIHIVEGTRYDGFFEEMADRVAKSASPEQKETILRLKFETPADEEIHGVEYYEAVISAGVTTMAALREWVKARRSQPPYYWMPERP